MTPEIPELPPESAADPAAPALEESPLESVPAESQPDGDDPSATPPGAIDQGEAEADAEAAADYPGEGPAEPAAEPDEAQAGPGEAPSETQPEPAQPAAASEKQPEVPAMPAMPGEPSDDSGAEEDDDIEIPEEVHYDEILKTSDAVSEEAPEASSRELIQGVVVSQRHDGVFVDIGQKAEAFLPVDAHRGDGEMPEVGASIEVIVTGQSHQGYLRLSSLRSTRPGGWGELEAAFNAGRPILGTVIGTTKGGLAVDVGVRAFMPASRSGARTEEDLQALAGQEIRARIVQLDEADRNVVLDRRSVLNEERNRSRGEALANIEVGETVPGTVRNIRDFGAFVDIGGIDGLLHISDIAWRHIANPSDVLHVGQKLQVKVLKIDRASQKVGLGLKQTQPEPWSQIGDRIVPDQVIEGTVTKLKEFGAFVEVLPDVEGLVRISDLSYTQRVEHPSEVLEVGEVVRVLVKNVDIKRKRIGLSLKEALGDPWKGLADKHPVGSVITGTVRKIMSFGAFVSIGDGVDGLLHISDITTERRLNSPAEMLRVDQEVTVKVLELNPAERKLKLGMKQLEPSETESAMAEMAVGEVLMGRVAKVEGGQATVEIGDGVKAVCAVEAGDGSASASAVGEAADVGSMATMLESALKGGQDGEQPEAGSEPASTAPEPLTAGSTHNFRITKLDKDSGVIELDRA